MDVRDGVGVSGSALVEVPIVSAGRAVPSFLATMWRPELQGEFGTSTDAREHIKSKYCLAIRSFSGVNHLGDVLTGGPLAY